MKKNLSGFSLILVLAGLFLLMASYVYATATDPTGPQNIKRFNSSRFNTSNWPSIRIDAEAGNVTELLITSLTQTQTWQGYYGNITGTITLDDANNWTMYSWALAEPQGEIYASNGSIVIWDNIRCVNYSNDGATGNYSENITKLETWLGLHPMDVDGIDETFNETGILSDGATPHPTFYVGTHTIAQGTCPATDTYQNDSKAGIDFVEVLLTDNQSIIFTTIIENDNPSDDTDIYGFDNKTHDFQMIVGDNGHDGDDTITPYYFFVELE